MNKRMLIQFIVIKSIFALLFLNFAIDHVNENGWTIFAIILVMFATSSVYQILGSLKIYQFFKRKRK